MEDVKDTLLFTGTALSVTPWNFESRSVQFVDENTLRIRPGIRTLAFSMLFVFLGMVLVGLWMANTFTAFEGPASMPLALIGTLFVVSGLWTYHGGNEQVVITRESGVTFVRSWKFTVPLDATSVFKHIPPQELIAIELASRVVKHRSNRSIRSSSFTEYQVNLRSSEDELLNIFITLQSKKAEELGRQLARLFNVPIEPA